MATLNPSWCHVYLVPLGLLGLSGLATAQPRGPDISPRIIDALKHDLKPEDLALSAAKLRAKLDAIGEAKDLFHVAEDRSDSVPMPGLSKVGGSRSEVMAVLEPDNPSDSPRLTYWIGVVQGHIAARAIPPNPDDMIGPVYGVWRRRGKVLVGVGYDASYHSPKWIDAEIYGFTDTKSGPRMDQRLEIEGLGRPFGFVNATSLAIDCRQSAKNEYEMVIGRRNISPACNKIWEFRNGRYVLARTIPIHDELWAINRLLTAVAKHKQRILNAMIPNNERRKDILNRLQSAIDHEAFNFDEPGEATLVSKRFPGFGVDIELVNTKLGWVVRSVETKHLAGK